MELDLQEIWNELYKIFILNADFNDTNYGDINCYYGLEIVCIIVCWFWIWQLLEIIVVVALPGIIDAINLTSQKQVWKNPSVQSGILLFTHLRNMRNILYEMNNPSLKKIYKLNSIAVTVLYS